MVNGTPVAYVDYGGRRPPVPTARARRVKEIATRLQCALVALRISADALSRFTLRTSGHGPHPDRQLSQKFRAAVAARCGRQDVRMMERDDRPNASCREYRSFDGPLPDRSLWRFPRIDEVELVRDRLVRVDKEA